MHAITVFNKTNQKASPLQLGICDTFISRLRGLMFSKNLAVDGGLCFVNSAEDRLNSAIHMFFMNYDLTILWADSEGRIVDKILAKKWSTIAAPQRKAKFILETHIDRFEEYNIGDFLEIRNV